MSVHRYSMGNRDLIVMLDDDPQRCTGLNARYAVRCRRRSMTHPTGLCVTHRDQEAMCRLCGDTHTCQYHAKETA